MLAYRKTISAVSLLGVLTAPAFAGKFKYGLNQSHEITLNVPRPPDAYLAKRNIAVQIAATPGTFRSSDQLRLSIEKALSPEFTSVTSQPEAVIRVDIITFEPLTSNVRTETEYTQVKTGEKRVPQKNGTVKTEPVYETRQVPVQHWLGRANLQVKWSVADAAGTALDAADASSPYSLDLVTARNGQSTNSVPPSAESVISEMAAGIASRFKTRYTSTHSSVKFLLAVDDELKDINKLAMAGRWSEALKQYEAVKMKNNPADRLYNIAAAKEALAYEGYARSQNIEEVLPLFTESMDLYDQALKMDPSEKYMQQASTRLRDARNSMDRANKHYAAQKFEAEKLIAEMTAKADADKASQEREEQRRLLAEEGAKDIESNRPDFPEEAKFRNYVRAAIKALPADALTDQRQAQMEAEGVADWRLEAMKAKRVVVQEVRGKRQLAEGLRKYQEKFALFAEDKKISREERQALSDLSELWTLSADDINGIEAKVKITDETKRPPAANTRPAAPPARTQTSSQPKPAVTAPSGGPSTAGKKQ